MKLFKPQLIAVCLALLAPLAFFTNTEISSEAALLESAMGELAKTKGLIAGTEYSANAKLVLRAHKISVLNHIASIRKTRNCQELLAIDPQLENARYIVYPRGDQFSTEVACAVTPNRLTARTITLSGTGNLRPLNAKLITSQTSSPGLSLTSPPPTAATPITSQLISNAINAQNARTHIENGKLYLLFTGNSLLIEDNPLNINGAGLTLAQTPSVVRSSDTIRIVGLLRNSAVRPLPFRQLVHRGSGTCLSLTSEATPKVVLEKCLEGKTSQHFNYIRLDQGAYQIRHRDSQLCLQFSGLAATGPLVATTCSAFPTLSDTTTLRQAWRLDPAAVTALTSAANGRTINVVTSRTSGLLTLVHRAPSVHSAQWVDSASGLGVYEKRISITNPVWTNWARITGPSNLHVNSPAGTIHPSTGGFTVASSDSTVISVFSSNGVEQIRTQVPRLSPHLIGLGYKDIPVGNSQLRVLAAMVGNLMYFKYFNPNFISEWSRPVRIRLPEGVLPDWSRPLELSSTSPGRLVVDIPISQSNNLFRIDFDIKVSAGICTISQYASRYNLTPDTQSILNHYKSTGKNLNYCAPVIEECTVATYLERNPQLAGTKWQKNAIGHWNDYGIASGACRPFIPSITVQEWIRTKGPILGENPSPLKSYLDDLDKNGHNATTRIPNRTERCTPSEYFRRKPELINHPTYAQNPGLHYAMYGINEALCEPSLDDACDSTKLSTTPKDVYAERCLFSNPVPAIVTGDFYTINPGHTHIRLSCASQIKLGKPFPDCLGDRDNLSWPPDGPQVFLNSPGYFWRHKATVPVNSEKMIEYSPTIECNSVNHLQKMRGAASKTPGVEHMYECMTESEAFP